MSQKPIKSRKSKAKKAILGKKKSLKGVDIHFVLTDTNKERVEWMSKLLEMQRNSVFVDSTIITSDFKKFSIDRNMFAAISPYFMALYSNSLYTENQSREVFCRTSRIKDTNIEAVIRAANRLQITGALEYCYGYWTKSLDTKNCIRIYQMSRMYYAIGVIDKSKEFILYNFMAVVNQCPDFYSLSKDELSDILSDDRLNVSREELTYSAINSWISANH
ncbi:unnamed protein product [Oppiella nova]|uniref:BACK domain-containing protein n=1 Tax=Oppiella nova TaxID=334625 RepID=A0A7R9MCL8_9ACAR|nr:unnamed protein product [Oppiella nova]CAG2174879.1 unnamed protein product [Oppiella nova]